MRITHTSRTVNSPRLNGPGMVIQGARCDYCKAWVEFDGYGPTFDVNGFDVVEGPPCPTCELDDTYVLYYIEERLRDEITI